MLKETFIYKIMDKQGVVRYVGKSNNPRRRLYQHINDISNKHKYNWLQSIIKSGDVPIIEILEKVSMDLWKDREIFWISKLKEEGHPLLNMTVGGDGAEGMVHTEETKKRMSESKRGVKLSDEHKKKISQKVKEKYLETPDYNRSGGNVKKLINKDLIHQLYIVENLSISKISQKLNCSETKVFRSLKEWGIEKDKSEWMKQLATNQKVVLQYDLVGNLVGEWKSAVDVQKELNLYVSGCCIGSKKTCGGFIWRYKDE